MHVRGYALARPLFLHVRRPSVRWREVRTLRSAEKDSSEGGSGPRFHHPLLGLLARCDLGSGERCRSFRLRGRRIARLSAGWGNILRLLGLGTMLASATRRARLIHLV